MASKREESIVIKQGQPLYDADTPIIADIIQQELDVSTDEVSEKQATGLVNITGMSYEIGMFAGLRIGEQNGQILNKMLIFN